MSLAKDTIILLINTFGFGPCALLLYATCPQYTTTGEGCKGLLGMRFIGNAVYWECGLLGMVLAGLVFGACEVGLVL